MRRAFKTTLANGSRVPRREIIDQRQGPNNRLRRGKRAMEILHGKQPPIQHTHYAVEHIAGAMRSVEAIGRGISIEVAVQLGQLVNNHCWYRLPHCPRVQMTHALREKLPACCLVSVPQFIGHHGEDFLVFTLGAVADGNENMQKAVVARYTRSPLSQLCFSSALR